MVLLNTHWLQTQQTSNGGQGCEKKTNKKQTLSDMAPKFQSKTLETKAQTCPPSEAGFSAEVAAESSGEDVPDRRHG